jgi:DNA-binding winged helix-turn-helix (wHTH) protein/Tfp pilus assembly protein PilF/TolB-like protein
LSDVGFGFENTGSNEDKSLRKFPFFFAKSSSLGDTAVKDGTIYEFSDFRLIPDEDLLLRDGQPVPLPPKAYATLALLIERHGHLVKKSELMEKVWSDAFVEEAAVSKCVWTIRNALGEDSKSQRFIQTVPKRGYKFVADVAERRDHVPSEPDMNGNGNRLYLRSEGLPASDVNDYAVPSTHSAETAGRSLSSWNWMWYAVAASVVAVAIAVLLYLTSAGPSILTGSGNRIAVLPLKPIDATNRSDILEIGVADALINRLNLIKGFVVRPLSATRKYDAVDQDALAAGREQKVDHVIASNYQLADGKVRITAQLINVASGLTEDTFSVETAAGDIFAMHDAVSDQIVKKIAARFEIAVDRPQIKTGTNNEEAYRYYLLAQNFNEFRSLENGRVALEQIDKALALDPNFARAWAMKAYIHRYMGYGAVAIEHSLKSIEAVEKALALDPNLPEAHSVRCFNKFRYEYDFAGAEIACKRALELDPNSPLAHKLYGNFLYTRGRFHEAITEIKKAIDLQPVSYDNQQTYALALYFARRHADAEAQWKQLIPLNPDHQLIYRQLVKTLVPQGKEAEALEYLVKLLTMEEEDEDTIKRFRIAFANSGWQGVKFEQIRIAESRGYTRPHELARLYATINDKNNAFKYLERAFQERSNMIAVLEVDPELDSLRNDPRYEDLVRRIEGK